jgi:H+/Cl- antiporter ClcA
MDEYYVDKHDTITKKIVRRILYGLLTLIVIILIGLLIWWVVSNTHGVIDLFNTLFITHELIIFPSSVHCLAFIYAGISLAIVICGIVYAIKGIIKLVKWAWNINE